MVTIGPTAGETLCFLAVFALGMAAMVSSVVFGIKNWNTMLGKIMAIVPGALLSLVAAAIAYLVLFNAHRMLYNYFNNPQLR